MEKQEGGGRRMKMMSNIDFLPNDVLARILTKLPSRKLLQLRWVCKNWFGLISDSSFVKMHYDNAIVINHPLVVFSHWLHRSYNTPLVDEYEELRLLNSCNGLLCIKFSILAGIYMIIWNPCTREYKNIPCPPILSQTHMRCENYGFGYDCIGNDYKIVRSTCFYRAHDRLLHYYFLVDVYTLGTESWKRINGNYPYKLPFGLSNDEGVFVNGGLYWIVEKSGVSDKMVIRFDVAKEEYKEISVPQSVVNGEMTSCHIQLIELEGCLCILTEKNFREMKVWRMKDYGVNNKENSWTNLFTVKEPIIECNNQAMTFKVIRICKNGEVLVIEGRRRIVWYNPSTDKTRFISKIPDIDKFNLKVLSCLKVLDTCTCIESLMSLNSGTYMGRDLEEEDRQQFRILALGSSTSIVNELSL